MRLNRGPALAAVAAARHRSRGLRDAAHRPARQPPAAGSGPRRGRLRPSRSRSSPRRCRRPPRRARPRSSIRSSSPTSRCATCCSPSPRETKVNVDIHPGVEGSGHHQRDRPDAEADPHAHLEAGRHALRDRRPDHPRDARHAVPAQLPRRLREHGARHHGNGGHLHAGHLGGTVGRRRRAGATGDNNSTLRISNTSRNRFWETLEKNIKDMLRETDKLLPEGSSETFVSGARPDRHRHHAVAALQRRAATATGRGGQLAARRARPRSRPGRRRRSSPRNSSSSASRSARPPR